MNPIAVIYLRRNGAFGSSCNGVRDTGHTIVEGSGLFTVWSINDGREICSCVSRREAERAIADDWFDVQ